MKALWYCCLIACLAFLGCNEESKNARTSTEINSPKVDQTMFDRLSREMPPASELEQFSAADLRILRNSIFARHGYKFKSADLREYFSQFAWYEPRFNDVYSMLSSIEKKNIEFIKSMEDRMAKGGEPAVKLPRAEVNEAMFERLAQETPSVAELRQYSNDELRILRNSIFARHGYKFKSPDLQEYFARFPWYEPLYADVFKQLNSIEKKNINLIKAMEDSDGNVISDARDGKTYKTVTIGSQIWMAENLNYKTNGSWCYANQSSNCSKYGRLYSLSAARKACPEGWHLPRFSEWRKLSKYVEKNGHGKSLDESLMSKSGWSRELGLPKGANTFGFNALPGGIGDGSFADGQKILAMFRTYESANFFLIGYGDLGNDDSSVYDNTGLSVRCVKD